MKSFPLVILTIVILIACYAVYRYTEIMAPTWQVTAAQQAAIDLQASMVNAHTDVQAHAERAQWWTGALSSFSGLLFMLVAAVGSVYAWTIYDKRRESWARPVDGQYALQTFKANGQIYVTDPNKAIFGVFGHDQRTGNLITDASLIGPDRQLAYATAVQKTRTVSAGNSGDGIRYAAHAKLLAGAYDRPVSHIPYDELEAPEDEPVTPFQPLTVIDAFNQSTATRWILGQSPTTGELFELNPKESSHFGIVGANGTGKTAYTALLLMAYALRHKYRVVILDGKGGADWSKYEHLAEYYPLDYTNVGDYVFQMVREYGARQALLNQHKANSIWELPAGVSRPRPTLFIVDEFGAVMDGVKAAKSRAERAEFDVAWGNFLRLSRAAGLYVIPCDQNPSKWPGTMRANFPVNLCYRLGGGIGNAVQEYNLDRLNRVGQFQVSNKVYDAFKTYEVIDQLLPDVSYQKPKALLSALSVSPQTDKVEGGAGSVPLPLPDRQTDRQTTGQTSFCRCNGQADGCNGMATAQPYRQTGAVHQGFRSTGRNGIKTVR